MGVELIQLPWHRITSLHCGTGTAEVVSCRTREELLHAAGEYPGMKILGGGTNTVGSDRDGIRVLRLLQPESGFEIIDGGKGIASLSGGAGFSASITALAKCGLGGISALAGIPGSVGGAAAMNAGANGGEIADFILEMEGVSLNGGAIWKWRREEGGFGYRTSPRPEDVVITSVLLRLRQVEPESEMAAVTAEKQRRARVTPSGFSAGSVFRNPPEAPAGKMLEEAGCKGLVQGNLMVSSQHANWIVNPTREPASAEDALRLTEIMADKVLASHGVRLQCEWKFIDGKKR